MKLEEWLKEQALNNKASVETFEGVTDFVTNACNNHDELVAVAQNLLRACRGIQELIPNQNIGVRSDTDEIINECEKFINEN